LDPPSTDEVLQAFAGSYLASYADNPFPARVETAFFNAFKATIIARFPKVDNVSLGCVVLQIPFRWGNHIVVCLEGIRTGWDCYTSRTGTQSAVYVADPLGYVMAAPKIYQEALWAQLTANDAFLTQWTRNSTRVTFAGYSMGSAVADIQASISAAAYPATPFKLIKFAPPAVGTAGWYANRPGNLTVRSFLNKGDWIYNLPMSALARSSTNFWAYPTGAVGFARDLSSLQLNQQLEWGPIRRAPSINEGLMMLDTFCRNRQPDFSVPYNVEGTTSNDAAWACYYHRMIAYRHSFNQIARRAGGLLDLRFNFLEFPDENIWQRDWRGGGRWHPEWIAVEDPGPAPMVIPFSDHNVERLHNAQQPELPPVVANQQTLPDMIQGVPDPLTQLNRRRAQHHPMVSP